MKKNYTLSVDTIQEMTRMAVVSIRDYRRLLTRAVQEYAMMGYVLVNTNTIRSGKEDYILMRCGKNSVIISTSTTGGESIVEDTMTMTVKENKKTVFSRVFYQYKTNHAHAHNKNGYGEQHWCSTRLCDSIEERDKMRSKRIDRHGSEDKNAPLYKVYSKYTTPRWNDIVGRLLPVIRSVRGYKAVTASKVNHVSIWKCHSRLNDDGVYKSEMVAHISIEGKDKKIEFRNSYYTPAYYEDVHGARDKDSRMCVHGFYLPSSYASANNNRGWDSKTRIFYLFDANKQSYYDRVMGYVAVCRHPFYGMTYVVLDRNGKIIANRYVPTESSNGYSAFLYGKQSCLQNDGIVPLILETERSIVPKEFFTAKVKEFDYNDYRNGQSLSLGMMRYWENTKGWCDFAAYDKAKWNSLKEVEFHDNGTITVYGNTFTIKKCEMSSHGFASISAVGGKDDDYEIRFSANKEYTSGTYNGYAKIVHNNSPYIYESLVPSSKACEDVFCFAQKRC